MYAGCTDAFWHRLMRDYVDAVLGTDFITNKPDNEETGEDRLLWARYFILTEMVAIEGGRRARLRGEKEFMVDRYHFTVSDNHEDLFPYWCALQVLHGIEDFATFEHWQEDTRHLADAIVRQAPPHLLYTFIGRYLDRCLAPVEGTDAIATT